MFLFKPACAIEIQFDDKEKRTKVEFKRDKQTDQLCLFVAEEALRGTVNITVPPGKVVDHIGIKVELIGQIELFYDRGHHYEFTTLLRDLAPPGTLTDCKIFNFEFLNVEKQFESYNGTNVKLRYYLKVTITRTFPSANIVEELDFWVHNYHNPPEVNNTIKMEVGIEDCLHIEFEYNKSKYHLKDVIIGKIYFLLVRIKVKHMEIALVKRESTGSGPNLYNETENLTKFEIMDGAPVRGECIPVRLFLGGFDLTPSYRNVHNKFSVKYFLNLVLVDEEDRRYFKQQEVVLWRKQAKKQKGKKKLQSTDFVSSRNKPNEESKEVKEESKKEVKEESKKEESKEEQKETSKQEEEKTEKQETN